MNFIPLASPDINADDISAVTHVFKERHAGFREKKCWSLNNKLASYLHADSCHCCFEWYSYYAFSA
jgi:dTDP-4-amino-4,6-dideoxygalactose transaminase